MSVDLENTNPKTLEEAVQILIDSCTEEERATVKDWEPFLHFGMMRLVRNFWGLWRPESELHQHFVARFGIGHADDMSGLIQEMFLARIKGEEFGEPELEAEVERYKRHWRELGVNPLTQESIVQA